MNEAENKRNYFIDNSKAILIFLVVLGHLLESFPQTEIKNILLLIIYSFHIPLFVYFSGYLAKYNPSKIVKNILIPYLIIEMLSFVFYNTLFGETPFRMITGYTSLWYMISLFTWYLLIPILDNTKYPKLTMLFLLILGLVVGYDDTASTVFSISRTVTFLPFFALGFYTKKYNWFKNIDKTIYKIISLILIIVIVVFIINYNDVIKLEWLYGYMSYNILTFSSLIRIIIYIVALVWLMFFKAYIPNKKIILSKIGKNSLSAYLLHYFIVSILVSTQLLYFGSYGVLNAFIFATVITIIFSTDTCNKVFKRIFCISFDSMKKLKKNK